MQQGEDGAALAAAIASPTWVRSRSYSFCRAGARTGMRERRRVGGLRARPEREDRPAVPTHRPEPSGAAYSHSMAAGGFKQTSSATRCAPGISLMIRL